MKEGTCCMRTTMAPLNKMKRRPHRSTRYHLHGAEIRCATDRGGRYLRRKRAQNVNDCIDTRHQNGVTTNPSGLCRNDERENGK